MSSSAANEELNKSDGSQSSGWVRFEEEDGGKIEVVATETGRNKNNPETSSVLSGEEYSGAVINTESPQVTLDRSSSRGDKQSDLTSRGVKLGPQQYSGAVISAETVHVNLDRSSLNRSMSEDPQHDLRSPSAKPQDSRVTMRTVDLREVSNGRPTTSNRVTTVDNAHIRQGFANGDIIVTLLPVNTRWPWITPAQFRPELVPEELMAQGLTLTVEDYVHVMEILTNDVRFNIYNVCYKRILVVWIFTAFVVLLGLLFSGVTGLTLFGLGVMWLVLNALAIFFCMWIKIKLNHNLERCMAQVNKHLIHHKIILGLDDRGKLSCHKVNLCFIYFDTVDCIKKLQEVIDREEREGRPVNREETPDERRQRQQFQQRMDIEDRDIIIQGSSTTRLSRKQERAEMVFLRYSHRWAKEFVRRHLELSVDGAERGGFPPAPPRHCITARCPCQFIEEHLKYKPRDAVDSSVRTVDPSRCSCPASPLLTKALREKIYRSMSSSSGQKSLVERELGTDTSALTEDQDENQDTNSHLKLCHATSVLS